MKNKCTILLIILCILCGGIYIFDIHFNKTISTISINTTNTDNDILTSLYTSENTELNTEQTTDKNINNIKNNDINKLININTANKEDLKKLPNIGDTVAQNIIEYRENVSLFYSIEDIKNVSRIGEKTFEKIKDLITVN